MTFTTTVTQKGQITLPIQIRKRLKVATRDKVTIRLEGNRAIVEPLQTILDLAGSVKPVKGMTALKARELMQQGYGQDL